MDNWNRVRTGNRVSVLALLVVAIMGLSACAPAPDHIMIDGSDYTTFTLEDGTRCVVVSSGHITGISCDFSDR